MMRINLLRHGCVRPFSVQIGSREYRGMVEASEPLERAARAGRQAKLRLLGPLEARTVPQREQHDE